jgi:LPXTG-motif cell wall-anchored protein
MLTGADGARANVRQVTIILSLGIAQANSGENASIGVLSDKALAARVGTNPDAIATGDGDAENGGLIIICQRRNADDIACLAPPEDPPADPETPTTTTPVETCCTIIPDDPNGPDDCVIVTDGTFAIGKTRLTRVPCGPSLEVVTPAPTTTISWTNGSGDPVTPPRANITSQKGGMLPSTGMDASDLLMWAAILLGLGTAFYVLTRRRQPAVVSQRVLMSRLPEPGNYYESGDDLDM